MEKPKNRNIRHLLKASLPGLLIVIGAFWLAFQFMKPAPPSEITIAAGSSKGAYYRYATELASKLSEHGVNARVLQTEGSVDNLGRLAKNEVDMAFLQSGIADAAQYPTLRSIASLYPEPIWIFHTLEKPPETLAEAKGLRLAIGSKGSGTRQVVEGLLAANNVSADNSLLMPLTSSAVAAALRDGSTDIGFIVAGIDAPVIQELLYDPKIQIFDLKRAAAYERRDRRLKQLSLPAGVLNPATMRPREDIHLLTSAATLVISEEFHPALVDLTLMVGQPLFAKADLLKSAGSYPATGPVDFPLVKEAKRYLERGPSFLQRYLPYWAATLLDRLFIMLLPLITILIPLIKLAPPIYRWRIRSRVYRWYDELEEIDAQADDADTERSALLKKLDKMLADVMSVDVPLAYADQVYHLRQHMELVRNKVQLLK